MKGNCFRNRVRRKSNVVLWAAVDRRFLLYRFAVAERSAMQDRRDVRIARRYSSPIIERRRFSTTRPDNLPLPLSYLDGSWTFFLETKAEVSQATDPGIEFCHSQSSSCQVYTKSRELSEKNEDLQLSLLTFPPPGESEMKSSHQKS